MTSLTHASSAISVGKAYGTDAYKGFRGHVPWKHLRTTSAWVNMVNAMGTMVGATKIGVIMNSWDLLQRWKAAFSPGQKGWPSIPNYGSFWSGIKSTSRSCWRWINFWNGGTPKWSISTWDVPWNKHHHFWGTPMTHDYGKLQVDHSRPVGSKSHPIYHSLLLRRIRLCPPGCATTGTIRRIEVVRWGLDYHVFFDQRSLDSVDWRCFFWKIYSLGLGDISLHIFTKNSTEIGSHRVTGGSGRIANRSLSSNVWNSADPWAIRGWMI